MPIGNEYGGHSGNSYPDLVEELGAKKPGLRDPVRTTAGSKYNRDFKLKPEVNPSQLFPVEFKILVKLDEVGGVTSGGIIIPISIKEKQQMHQVQATLIAAGGDAFEGWKGRVPKLGDKVYVAKAAGYQVVGMDREKYQLMNDKDIAAVIGS